MLIGQSLFPCLPLCAARRLCMAQMSRVTRPSLPKFLPVEDADNALRITSNGPIFRVVSYNILAQVYVKSSLFPHSPPPCLRWKARSPAILQVLKSFEADFLCLQELDEYDSFYEGHMKDHGYSSVYIQRTGQKRDGCGIFYKGSCADLMLKEEIEYNDLVNFVEDGKVLCGKKSYVTLTIKERTDTSAKGLPEDVERDTNVPHVRLKRDCVGLMAAFKLKDPYNHLVIVANTHIYWDPELADIKLAQAKYLLSRLHQFKALVSEKFKCTPSIIITGDFNSTPGDKVYQYLVSGSSPSHQADFYEEQPIPLSSLYASVREEPPFTNCTPGFTGTLDYVLFSAGGVLKPVSFLELPGPGSPDIVGGLPNFHHPSDHLPIGGDFEVNTTSTLEGDLKLLHI